MFVPAKKIDTLYVTTTLTSQFFFPPLFVSILQKEKIIGKKLFFVCMSDVSIKIKDLFKLMNFCSFITQFHSYYLSKRIILLFSESIDIMFGI